MSSVDSEINYDVVPVNSKCSQVINTSIIQPQPGSVTASSAQSINDVNDQHTANIKYDTIGNVDVKPLYGGGIYRNFKIIEVNGEEIKLKGRVSIKENSTPLNAAKKLLTSYAKYNKLNNNEKTKLKITFKIKETTYNSNKKTYGPYIGKYYKYTEEEATKAMFAGIKPRFKPIVKRYF